jgi:hypothetical protein
MARLEIRKLTPDEQETIDRLKTMFNQKTRTNIVRMLIRLAKEKYL